MSSRRSTASRERPAGQGHRRRVPARRREGALLLVAALALVGCAASPDLTPRPARLTPGGGPSGVTATVTITGAGFLPRVVQSASGGPQSVDTTHRAWLDDVELADVTWVDTGTLRATVPAGLPLGPHALTVENALGRRGTLPAAWTVIDPAVLTLAATLAPAQASTGQPLALAVTATNPGGAAIHGLAVTVAPSGVGAVTGDLAPAPFDLAPGESHLLDLALVASDPGALVLSVAAAGLEEASGRMVTATAPDLPLLVQARAALTAALSLPSTIPVGATFTVTMLVENGGEAAALGVTPDPLAAAADATGGLLPLAGPAPAVTDVAGGGQAAFTWTYQLTTGGTVRLRGGAAGQDANDGEPVVAAPVDSNLGSQLLEVAPVAVDPLGDGTPVAGLAVRGGRLYVGPSRAGSAFWRLDPAGGAGVLLPVEIAVDTGSSPADNSAWRASPPATTFGTTGCSNNSTACGPNNEGGLGVLATGTAFGAEWLVYGSATRAPSKARYVYAASQDGPPLPFSAVDLGALLPNQVEAFTAIAFAPAAAGGADRLYLALAAAPPLRSPYLLAVATAPTGPVLDARAGSDAEALGAADMPGIGSAATPPNPDPQPRIDALAWFADRLYLATGGTLLRSTVAAPRAYAGAPADWTGATPLDPAWTARRGLPASAAAGLTPADRAVPAMVAFGDCGGGPCLFLARNVQGTTPAVVPQLWRCDPTATADPTACDPGDWSLAAPNSTGDATLTQLDVPTNGAVTLLLATGRYLYLGFDDATTGAQLYRAEAGQPGVADFRGRDGCVAGQPGCEGLGGNGFGDATVTRLFDAEAVTTGGATTLYVAAGDAAAPLRLLAFPE